MYNNSCSYYLHITQYSKVYTWFQKFWPQNIYIYIFKKYGKINAVKTFRMLQNSIWKTLYSWKNSGGGNYHHFHKRNLSSTDVLNINKNKKCFLNNIISSFTNNLNQTNELSTGSVQINGFAHWINELLKMTPINNLFTNWNLFCSKSQFTFIILNRLSRIFPISVA